MFLLKKAFQLRDKANPDHEKPFLEHLEDLRLCITRMTLVLLVATIACFIFRNDLMDIIKKPVSDLYESRQVEALKELEVPIKTSTWENATLAARDLPYLSDEERKHHLKQFADGAEDFEFHVQSVILFRAASAIPDEKERKTYIEELPGIEDRMRNQLLGLIVGNPEADIEAKGRLVRMQSLTPTEGFMLSIKLAFFAGIVVSFPFLLYFLLQFTLPGLHDNERKALFPAMAVGFGLFLGGVFFSYFFVLPRVLEFFHTYSMDMGIQNEWRIGYYISFATQFTLIFGLAFELPVVVMTLVKLGIMNYEMMKRTRSYAVLAMFVIAAIITPTPDAFTLCFLALPMVILYEICIWLAYFLNKKEREEEEREEKERMERLLAAAPKAATGTEAIGDDDDHLPEDHPDHDYHDHNHHGDDHEDHDFHGEDHDEHQHRAEDDGPVAPEFDFHEETDPGATEEGEGEDISDPWPEEDDEDDDGPPQDIPDEEKNR